jgi:hypothetical protein
MPEPWSKPGGRAASGHAECPIFAPSTAIVFTALCARQFIAQSVVHDVGSQVLSHPVTEHCPPGSCGGKRNRKRPTSASTAVMVHVHPKRLRHEPKAGYGRVHNTVIKQRTIAIFARHKTSKQTRT